MPPSPTSFPGRPVTEDEVAKLHDYYTTLATVRGQCHDHAIQPRVVAGPRLHPPPIPPPLPLHPRVTPRQESGSSEITKEVFVNQCRLIDIEGEAVDRLFSIFDADGSGSIDFTELAIFTSLLAKGAPSEKLAYAFRVFDTDGNGVLDHAEVRRACGAGCCLLLLGWLLLSGS